MHVFACTISSSLCQLFAAYICPLFFLPVHICSFLSNKIMYILVDLTKKKSMYILVCTGLDLCMMTY